MSRFVVFSALYLPHVGGVERYTYNLAKKLVKMDHEVIIITSNIVNIKFEFVDGIKIYRLPSLFFLEGRLPILLNSKYLHWVLNNIIGDFVIINSRFYMHSLFGLKYSKKHKLPYIVIEHGSGHLSLNNCLLDKFLHVYEHILTNHIKRNYSANFYGVSDACNKWLEHFGIKANGILYNSVNNQKIQMDIQKSDFYLRKKFDIPSDSIIVTYVGRMVEKKGVQKLIAAIDIIKHDFNNIRLVLVGDGPLCKEIKKRNNPHVLVLGKQKHENIVAILSQSDIFCLPTDFLEGFPTSILEAAASRCFIIATDIGGIREFLVNSNYGLLLKDTSPNNIADSIRYAVSSPCYRKKCIDLAYKRLADLFTWDNTYSIFMEEVRKIEKKYLL